MGSVGAAWGGGRRKGRGGRGSCKHRGCEDAGQGEGAAGGGVGRKGQGVGACRHIGCEERGRRGGGGGKACRCEDEGGGRWGLAGLQDVRIQDGVNEGKDLQAQRM